MAGTVRNPTKNPTEKDFWSWLAEWVNKGYCSDIYCENHDTVAKGDWEEYMEYVEQYGSRDFCWSIARIYYGVSG